MTAESARDALIELASTWRKGFVDPTSPVARVMLAAARELDELTITHLAEDDEDESLPAARREPPARSWTCQRRILDTRVEPDPDNPGGFKEFPDVRVCGFMVMVGNPVDLAANVALHEAGCVPVEDDPDGGES